MIKRLTIIAGIVALGFALSGCSKCGTWWWEDAPRSCKSDLPK